MMIDDYVKMSIGKYSNFIECRNSILDFRRIIIEPREHDIEFSRQTHQQHRRLLTEPWGPPCQIQSRLLPQLF